MEGHHPYVPVVVVPDSGCEFRLPSDEELAVAIREQWRALRFRNARDLDPISEKIRDDAHDRWVLRRCFCRPC